MGASVDAHDADETTCTQTGGSIGGVDGACGETVGIAAAVAGACETARSGAFSAAVGEMQGISVSAAEEGCGVGIGSGNIAAGIAVVEIACLRDAHKTADAVGKPVVPVRVAPVAYAIPGYTAFFPQITGDMDRSETVVECENGAVGDERLIGGAAGLDIANQTAHGAVTPDAIGNILRIAGVIHIQIDAAVGKTAVGTGTACQSAGGRIVLPGETVAVDYGIDDVNVVNRAVDIAEKARKPVLIRSRGTGVIGAAYGISAGVDIQVSDLDAVVVEKIHAPDIRIPLPCRGIVQTGDAGIAGVIEMGRSE